MLFSKISIYIYCQRSSCRLSSTFQPRASLNRRKMADPTKQTMKGMDFAKQQLEKFGWKEGKSLLKL